MRSISDDIRKYFKKLKYLKNIRIEIWLILIILFAIAIRLYYFLGMNLNDDLCYLNCAHEIFTDEFTFPKWIFMPRLMVHYPIAFFYKIFGVSDFSASLYFLLCSIGSVFVAYGIGNVLYNKKVGLASALLMSFFPIEVIYATTIVPDVPLAFFLGLTILFFLMAEKQDKNLYYLLSGLCLGAAWLVKSLAVIIFLFFLFYIVFDIFFNFKAQIRGEKFQKNNSLIYYLYKSVKSKTKIKHKPNILRKIIVLLKNNIKRSITLGGFGIVLLLEGILYHSIHGDFFLRYNIETQHYVPSLIGVNIDTTYYPNILLAKNALYFNFLGLFFIFFCFSAFLLFFEKKQKYLILIIWAATILIWLQYGTMNPYEWVPMQRIYRFLTIISIPFSVTIASFIVESKINKKRVFNIINIIVISVLIISSMHCISNSHLFMEQSMLDFKLSADYLREHPGYDIYADQDTCGKLNFLLSYERTDNLKCLEYVENITEIQNAYVIVDSSRGYIDLPELKQCLPAYIWDPPPNWELVKVITESYLDAYGSYDTKIYFVP